MNIEKFKRIDEFVSNIEPIEKLYFNDFFEKDQVKRLQSIVSKVHIGIISPFRTSVESGFAGFDVVKEYLGSEIPVTNEQKFLDEYMVNVGEKYSRKLNLARFELLGNFIRSWKKVSFKAITGGFKEEVGQKIEQERSYLLISRPDVSFDEFRNVVIGLGVLFGQDSVFLKEANKESKLIITNHSSVISESGIEVDNGKYVYHITGSKIGQQDSGVKFDNKLNKILSRISDTSYAYSIFDKYGMRLDTPDRASIGDDGVPKNRVFTANTIESVHNDSRYDIGVWHFYVEKGEPFPTINEKYVYQKVSSFINFSKVW